MYWPNERSKLTGLIKNKISRSILLITGTLIYTIFLQGCNTLYRTSTVDIEVMIPAKVKLPKKYERIAIKYNNTNISYNPYFAIYNDGEQSLKDTVNMDSIASEVYYDVFTEALKNKILFDSVVILNPAYYNDYSYKGLSLDMDSSFLASSLDNIPTSKIAVRSLKMTLKKFIPDTRTNVKEIDPEYGLYSRKEIEEIAETTGANLFLSLDFFAGFDAISYNSFSKSGLETVLNIAFWNIYDLDTKELIYFYNKYDTIYWSTRQLVEVDATSLKNAKKFLPERKDAVLNAADITGTNFAELLTPHWLEVQRMYYKSGNVELKEAEKLIQKNEWIEAAKIWKKNIDNKNKSIAAKSMFNLALACEIEGDIDAAIDWAVKSFHVYGSKNETHYFHCMDYLKILGQRKVDIKVIEKQINPEISDLGTNKK